jgi:heme-degrading monooxygenase HmoA
MIASFVRFKSPEPLHKKELIAMFESRRPAFEGMSGLIAKSFWIEETVGEFGGFYIWESRDIAESAHDAEWEERAVKAYGLRPNVRFLEVPIHINNRAATTS